MPLFHRRFSDNQLRPFVKRTLNRLYRQSNDQHVLAAIDGILDNSKAQTALHADIDGLAQHYAAQGDPAVTQPGPPKERPFLKWLWDHREEILAFILKIAGMFGFVALASPKGRAAQAKLMPSRGLFRRRKERKSKRGGSGLPDLGKPTVLSLRRRQSRRRR